MLSAVDNRRDKRILSDVLDHEPTHDDIRAFLRRLHTALSARALTLFGVTTEGSALSPAPLREVCGKWRHHICSFHLVAEVGKAGGGLWPGPASTWQPRHPHCPKADHARRPRRPRPAPKSGSPRKAPRCSPNALCWSNVTCTQPSARPCGASAVGGPSEARYGQSWTKCMRYAIDAGASRPLWTHGPNCGVGSSGAHRWGRH